MCVSAPFLCRVGVQETSVPLPSRPFACIDPHWASRPCAMRSSQQPHPDHSHMTWAWLWQLTASGRWVLLRQPRSARLLTTHSSTLCKPFPRWSLSMWPRSRRQREETRPGASGANISEGTGPLDMSAHTEPQSKLHQGSS